MTVFNWCLGCAFSLSSLLAVATAQAQPSPAQREQARNLMAEGRDLREQGELQTALKRFTAADTIMSVPTTGFEVAATQAELGKLVEARETLRRVLSLPPSADDPAPFAEARSKARALEQRLQARIGSLHLVVTGVAASETLLVTLDGEMVPSSALGLPFRVNPGKHVVVARAGGREARREVEAIDARALKVELDLAQAKPTEPLPNLDPEPVLEPVILTETDSPPQIPGPRRGPPTVTYVAGGIGVAGILVGGVTGLLAIKHKNAADEKCVNGQCPPSTWSDLDSARSMATVSTVGFVVGAVGLAFAGTTWLLREEPRAPATRSVRVLPDVHARGGSLNVAGRF